MKITQTISIFLTGLIFSTVSFGQTPNATADYLNVRGPIIFQKHSYNLVWSSHPDDNYFKQEYIPTGDTVSKFKTMILVDAITGKTKLKDVVSLKIAELKKLKESNPVVNYEVFDNSKNGEYMIDFLVSENTPNGKYISIVERNVYRYKTFTDKFGQKGVLLFGISTRSYGDDIDKFFSSLKLNRNELIDEVGQFNIPDITIAK